jgi:hypothetical protein
MVRSKALFFLIVSGGALGCANQTAFHTTPVGAKVYINGDLCGDSPCIYNSRYGFPDRIRVQLEKDGYESAEFFLDTQPPLPAYVAYLFGAYVFHTFPEEYRFKLKPKELQPLPAEPALATPVPPSSRIKPKAKARQATPAAPAPATPVPPDSPP